jgi:peroxiredoxin
MIRNHIAVLSAGLGALMMLAVTVWLVAAQLNAPLQAGAVARGRTTTGAAPESGQPLPEYHIANLDQQEIPADELRRGRVLLVYLTTSCEACVKETEVISRLHRDAPPDLRVYGIAIERPAQVATFVKEFDLKFPVLIDMGSQLTRSLDIHYFPSKYLVEDGIIKKVWRGSTQDEAELRRQLGIN